MTEIRGEPEYLTVKQFKALKWAVKCTGTPWKQGSHDESNWHTPSAKLLAATEQLVDMGFVVKRLSGTMHTIFGKGLVPVARRTGRKYTHITYKVTPAGVDMLARTEDRQYKLEEEDAD